VLVACYVTGVTEKMQSNSVQLRNIDFERYLNIQIPLPPIEVQKEIVKRLEKELGEADKVAAEFNRITETLLNLRKAILSEAFE
jgi:type I restriction enzyme S subunit